MKIQRGDVVFNQAGRPGVVMGRDELSGSLNVEANGENYEKARKYGFVNGMAPEVREQFQSIVDDVRQFKTTPERVKALMEKIGVLEQDPRNFRLVRYLRAEQAHMMYTDGITPNEYKIDEQELT